MRQLQQPVMTLEEARQFLAELKYLYQSLPSRQRRQVADELLARS
jgi:hypothetical protein